MILNKTSLSMPEAAKYLNKDEHGETLSFIKNFAKISPEKASALRKKIEALDLIKINEMNISKLIEFLPEDKENLNKVLVDVSLNEDETNNILQTIKENK